MENDGSEKQRTTRIRTGDFEEPFAQEANNRRQQGQPLRLIPPLQPIVSKHKARQNSWNWRPQSKITDDEKAEVHQVVYDLPTAPLSIQFASRRAPIGSRSPLLFLTTRAKSSSSHAGDTRWLHIQHTGIRFETFVERALAAADLPSETREGIRDWLSGLQTALESNVSNGMTFPATVKGSMFADADGCEKSMADHSCLFLALPYFLLSDGKYPNRDSQSHPVRALVERLYSNESPFSREFRQAVNQLDRTATKKILYVPQIWCLLIGNDYIVTCAPSQLHTRPTSYIATVPGDEHPATVRLKLRWGLVFCIRAEECKSWFDFLLRIHHIYSKVLRTHVDPERCTYLWGGKKIDSSDWSSILRDNDGVGSVFDIQVLLPNDDSQWASGTRREIPKLYLDISSTTVDKVNAWDVHPKTLEAFDVFRSDRVRNQYDREYQLNGPVSLALMDTMENHAEIRNLVDWDSRRSDLHQKGYLQRKNGRSSTEDRTYAESDLESSSFSMTDQRNHAPPAVLVYDQGLNSDDGWYGQSCPWPGCHDGYRRQRRKDIQKNAFWAPVGVTPVEIIQQGYRGYLTWRIYSEGKPEHEKAPEKARGPQTASHELGALAVDTSPWAYMHKSLSTKAVYVEHISVPSLKIAEIMTELRSAGCNELVTLGRDTTELIEHFVPSSIYPDVKGKAFGALYNILKRCQNLDRQALKKHGVVQASKQMQKMLQVSHSIRQGIFGRQDEVYILNSLVIAFERLVLWLIDFDTNMLLPRILSRPMDEDTETESDSMDNLDDALDSIMGGDPAAASDVQNPDPPGTATKSQPEKDTKGQIPQDRPQRSWKRAVGDLHDITKSLQRAKVEILRLFEEQIPLDLDAYSTVNPGGILASIVGSLAHGDSDLPLPLSRDNAHLSSIFSNSGRVSSQSVVQMNIAELYQEYCSRLRLAVREKPTRDLLDDLDLLEEELDSIIQVTESQQTVMRDFISHSWHRLPTQYDWVDDLNGSYRMLEKNISLYRDLKTQIAKLRKQVTLQIEFKQDNHGKAILVFTTMTAIFLPLSFVTSYFGMNASDIRDMAHGQWIYWAVSIPVTVCVVGFCMLVAYQGHRVQEYFR